MNYNDPKVVDAITEQLHTVPEIVNRFDFDNDGELDQRERQILRRVVRGEAKEKGDFDIHNLSSEILEDRYRLIGHLGKGGQGRTMLAVDAETNTCVVVKILEMGRLSSWKNLDLFEREANTLQSLEHEAIPRYIDSFPLGDPPHTFCIVQEYIHGEPILDIVQRSKMDESQVRDIMLQLVTTVDYIHSQQPEVIHRDIKPSNLIWDPETRTLHLIDFGASRKRVGSGDGSTIVGTHGYMPMEQYMGRTAPATDYYAIGATAVYLLTGSPPSEMPFERGRIQFEDALAQHSEFVPLLERLLNPIAEKRLSDPNVLRDLLHRLNLDDLPEELPGWLNVRNEKGGDILYDIRGTSDISIADRVNSFGVESGPRPSYYYTILAITFLMVVIFFALGATYSALFCLVGGTLMCLFEKSDDHLFIDQKGIHLKGLPEPVPVNVCGGAVVGAHGKVVLEFDPGDHAALTIPVTDDQQAFYICELINRKLRKFSNTK